MAWQQQQFGFGDRGFLSAADLSLVLLSKGPICGELWVRNLGQAHLEGALYNQQTVLPQGFDPVGAGIIRLE
ncbi:MAG: hypothetical protein Q6K80_08190 [Thermostichus sp. DG_1_6_bins_120]